MGYLNSPLCQMSASAACTACSFFQVWVEDKAQFTTPGSSPRSVLFIEQTPTIGIKIKVVERSGRTLHSWRRNEDGITCSQGAEIIPNCTQKSVLYDNICNICIPGAKCKEQIGLEEQRTECPAIYIEETSRSIEERSKEHWVG